MDLATWDRCDYLRGMLEYIQSHTTDRKMRLFACACSRRYWNKYPDDRCREFIIAIERFADGLESDASVDKAYFAAEEVVKTGSNDLADALLALYSVCGVHEYQDRIRGILAERVATLLARDSSIGIDAERHAQIHILKDIIGPLPFIHGTTISLPSHPELKQFASTMYDSADFSALPQFSTLLAAHGCSDSRILSHCQSSQPHSKGCWVIDLFLGKT